MNEIGKLVVSLSLSGGVLLLVLLSGRPLWKDRVSKTWQYYIWLIVIARLLLPVPTELEFTWERASQAGQSVQSPTAELYMTSPEEADNHSPSGDGLGNGMARPEGTPMLEESKENVGAWLLDKLWLLWLSVALCLLLQRVVTYCRFRGHIQRGWGAVTQPALLGTLAQAKTKAGVRCPVGLYHNPMVSSPLLLGFFRPVVVLPNTDLPKSELYYTLLHELTHYKRGDMFYKWLVQLTLCLHWFNPLVWWMAGQINRDCELSCDEALLRRLDAPAWRDYGDTLLHAMVAGERYPKVAVHLNESAQCLKERLGAIMRFGKKRPVVISLLLTCLLIGVAVAAGACVPQSLVGEKEPTEEELWEQEHSILWGYTEEDAYAQYPCHLGWTGLYSPQGRDVAVTLDHDSQGPYIFNLSWNVYGYNGEIPPSKTFPVWDEEEQERVTLTAYFSKYSEKIMRNPGAMQALRELMLEEYKHGKGRGDRETNFFIHVADDIGAVGAEKLAQRYYEDGLGIEFGEVLYLLDESIQREWLERAYAEGNKTLYSEVLECLYWDDRNNWMEMDPQVVEELAQQAYADDKVEIFDVLTWHMDRTALERWQERLEQENRAVYLPIVRESLRWVEE